MTGPETPSERDKTAQLPPVAAAAGEPTMAVPRPATYSAGDYRPSVYGARRRPDLALLIGAGILVIGLVIGGVLGLQALSGPDDPVSSTSFGQSAVPAPPHVEGSSIAPPTSPPRTAAPTTAPPATSTAAPSLAPGQALSGLRGSGSGMCLELAADQLGPGGVVLIAPCNGTPTQHWQFNPPGVLVNAATGLCLTVAGASGADNARVEQDPCQVAAGQLWRLPLDGADGTVAIQAQHSNKCLDVAGGAAVPGTPVVQNGCAASPAQRWTPVP